MAEGGKCEAPTPSPAPGTASGESDPHSSPTPSAHMSAVGGGGADQLSPHSQLDSPPPPTWPSFATAHQRRASYPAEWTPHAPSVETLVLAGFFYAGYADCVRCFYCGVGLKSWTVDDDVWDLHIRWRPSCSLVKCQKSSQSVSAEPWQLQSPSPPVQSLSADGEIGPGPQNRVDAPCNDGDTEDEELIQIQNEILQLAEENRRLREEQKCRICCDRDSDIVFLPCGHLVACAQCALDIAVCPICRRSIEHRFPVLRELSGVGF